MRIVPDPIPVTYAAHCADCNERCRTHVHSDRADFIHLHRDAGHRVTHWIEGPTL